MQLLRSAARSCKGDTANLLQKGGPVFFLFFAKARIIPSELAQA